MTRNEYIARQRQEHGRKAVAVLPIHYPRELLTALDLLAVELWGPPGPPRGDAAGRLQAYVCALARNALAFLAAGGADAVDAVLFPHTCDSLQGLATLAPDLGGWAKRALTFQHPRGPARPSARRYLEAELRALARGMEAVAGAALRPERLDAAVRLHAEIDAARAALLDGRAGLAMDDRELYALLRRGEWLWPEDHLAELRAALARPGGLPASLRVPVLVSGYVPEPAGVLEALNGAGAFVAADDYAAVGRRVLRPPADVRRRAEGQADEPAPERAGGLGGPASWPPQQIDPWALVLERYWAAPPCPTRAADPELRARHLAGLAERAGARGVVLHLVKNCEPELFDVPALRRAFAARGLPVLQLDGELEAQLPAQAVTRIEAFVELLAAGRAA